MISNLKNIVIKIVGDRQMKKEVYAWQEKVGDIERQLNDGKIDFNGAMNELKSLLSYNLSNDDYRKIEKEVGYNVR